METFLLAIIAALMGVSGYFLKRIIDDTTKLKKAMEPIAPAIIEIQGKFTQAGHTILFPMTVAPGSPLHVTEFGDDLLKESGFYEVLKDHGKELIQMVKDRKPATNYDIQKDSIEVIEEVLGSDHDMALPLKEYAYSKGIDLSVITLPAGIALRDEVMKIIKL
jgi:hypothetical protein